VTIWQQTLLIISMGVVSTLLSITRRKDANFAGGFFCTVLSVFAPHDTQDCAVTANRGSSIKKGRCMTNEELLEEECRRIEKIFPKGKPCRFGYIFRRLEGKSLGKTFVHKGMVYVGVEYDGRSYYLPPTEIEGYKYDKDS
jgi:hypothetical protein